MSSWLGGGSSVINLGFGGIGLLVDAAAAGVEGPKVVLLRVSHLIGECTYR
jgi:hypothetical protein